MKKIIYPIVAALVLSGVSAFAQTITSDDCCGKATTRELKMSGHNTVYLHDQHKVHEGTALTGQFHPVVQNEGSGSSSFVLSPIDMLDSLAQLSDEQIDSRFSREETTIEMSNSTEGDEFVTNQFYAENEPAFARQLTQKSN